jgi:hypothetical protein
MQYGKLPLYDQHATRHGTAAIYISMVNALAPRQHGGSLLSNGQQKKNTVLSTWEEHPLQREQPSFVKAERVRL